MKTQITDWLFLYNAIQQVLDKGLGIKLKIFYFSLEMSSEEKMRSVFSNLLYIKEGIRIAPKDLKSTKADKVLSQENLDLIKKYEDYFKKVEEIVTFIDDHRHSTGLFMFMKKYADANGTHHYKEVVIKGSETVKVFDYYEADDPDEYVMCIVDHIGLLHREKEGGRLLTLHECISKLSSQYLVHLRNRYNYIPVAIQQQAAEGESFERVKAKKIRPTLNTLADNKLTQRDANVILGLTGPYRHEIPEYLGYDITFFEDNIRFLEIIASRDGGGGTICPLYFDGAVNYFKELPLNTDMKGMEGVYKFIKNIRK